MEFNSVVFPAPKPTYNARDFKNLIFIPKDSSKKVSKNVKIFKEFKVTASIIESSNKENILAVEEKSSIPCLMFEYTDGSDFMIIYWHANAEDLGIASKFACKLKTELKVHVLLVEYPGYGIYKGNPNSHSILLDAEKIYDYVTKQMGIDSEKVILLGRSLGSAPATHVAHLRKCCALILISPFSSVKDVARNLIGVLSLFVADSIRNIDKIEKVNAPCLFIHGKSDRLIPFTHSIELQAKSQHKSFIHLPEEMTHNKSNFKEDIAKPILNFFAKIQLEIKHSFELIPRLSSDILNNNNKLL